MMKLGRQSVIMEIISERDIETQNQLMEALAERGVKSTQATLSRDIRDMRLVKELGPKGVVSYDLAQNILVIKTLPGLANGACSALDGMEIDGLVGTLAGDDTAFLAMKDNASALNLYKEIDQLF